MAERGAHLTSTQQSLPSIFEVVAADSLGSTFHLAIKKLCNVLAASNPVKFGWTLRHYDELYLALNAVIQQFYVRAYGGSLAEIFYGLTRSRCNGAENTLKSRCIIFASIVLVPYMRQRLEQLIATYTEAIESNAGGSAQHRRFKQIAVRCFRATVAAYDALQVFQYIAYMSGASRSHSLQMRALRMQLVYQPPDELGDEWTWTDLVHGKLKVSSMLTGVVFRALELSAFFLQFIQWWQTEANQGSLTNLPVPETPAYDANSGKYAGICPICIQAWTIPTAVTVSGYIYCYKCIVTRLQTNQRCPVSNYPASVDNLIRIFIE